MALTTPALTTPGIGSGLDINGIVQKLMQVESRPLDLLKQRETGLNTKLSAYGQVKSQLDSLSGAAANLSNASAWSLYSASLDDAKVAGATVTPGTTPGDYSIEVTQLARAQTLASGAYAASTTVVGTGALSIEIGTFATGTFTPNSGTSPVAVKISATSNTLAGVRDAINAAGAGVRATIVQDATGARLAISSNSTGLTNSLRITATDDDGNNTNSAGLSALAFDPAAGVASGKNLSQTQPALDATLKVDGLSVTSAGNTVTGAIDGITLNLTATNIGTATTLHVAYDRSAILKMAQDVVSGFNAASGLLAMLTKADPKGKATGPLQGDRAAVSILTSLRGLVGQKLEGSSSPYTQLSQVGIEMQRDGTLKLNAAKFNSAIDGGLGNVIALFSAAGTADNGATHGLALRMKDMLGTALASDGGISARSSGLQSSIKANTHQQDVVNARLLKIQENLLKQYQALDTNIARMSSIEQSLSQQLAQFTSSTK